MASHSSQAPLRLETDVKNRKRNMVSHTSWCHLIRKEALYTSAACTSQRTLHRLQHKTLYHSSECIDSVADGSEVKCCAAWPFDFWVQICDCSSLYVHFHGLLSCGPEHQHRVIFSQLLGRTCRLGYFECLLVYELPRALFGLVLGFAQPERKVARPNAGTAGRASCTRESLLAALLDCQVTDWRRIQQAVVHRCPK